MHYLFAAFKMAKGDTRNEQLTRGIERYGRSAMFKRRAMFKRKKVRLIHRNCAAKGAV